jgi:hypothetical protein
VSCREREEGRKEKREGGLLPLSGTTISRYEFFYSKNQRDFLIFLLS